MAIPAVLPEFRIERDPERCIACQVCVRVCAFEAHAYWEEEKRVISDAARCVGCQFCASLCPTKALSIYPHPARLRPNANWTEGAVNDVTTQAATGGVLLTGMGCDRPYPIYWDHLLLNAS
ncbi:MAG: 4Fe-4S binding protein, partial [Clostridia bacterium]|nr:4Fe-4S binding protein [Clostridia bacterium]